jgi:hypothetical protein
MFRITKSILPRSRGGIFHSSTAAVPWARVATSAFGTKAPGSNPLDVIRKECLARNLCDEYGYRRPGVHWVFSVAITPEDPSQVRSYVRFGQPL